jgi:hypothetical protein
LKIKHIGTYFLLCGLIVLLQPFQLRAQENSDGSKPTIQHTAAERDGQQDFDFEIGSWKIHLKRRLHPLTGSNTWAEFDGTSVTRKVWDGRSDLEEFETDSPTTGHIEGLTLRVYNPHTHLLGQQQGSRLGSADYTHDRPVQKWSRRVLRSGNIER